MSHSSTGYLSIVLHAHLPYVRHPDAERCLEEVWLFEALTECYLPLLEVFEGWIEDKIPGRMALSLSPPLLHMLADTTMRLRYVQHLERLIELSAREVKRLEDDPVLLGLAQHYQAHFEQTLHRYRDVYQTDVLVAFASVERAGVVELMTTAATHGFLPLLQHQPGAVHAQVREGLASFKHFFGHQPTGFWLPECGYFEEVDKVLSAAGVQRTFIDTHGATGAHPEPPQSCYAPIRTPAGVTVFARDPEASRQVWSSREGYPGDFDYREYYSDIGFSLPKEALEGYLLPDGTRMPTGIKYHRVSGANQEKEPYHPKNALAKARQHARHFVKSRLQRLDASSDGALPTLMVAPYDAELMGHWWYEGPRWLDFVMREVAQETRLEAVSPKDYSERYESAIHTAMPAASSWGQAGYNRFWINEDTAWVFPQVHQAFERLCALLQDFREAPAQSVQGRALRQAARALLLAQSSDWPFIMRAGTTTDYAVRRIQDELARFRYLEEALRKQSIGARELAALEILDDVFPHLDVNTFELSTF